MAKSSGKLVVVDEKEDTKVPFLRGILTRSLQDAGMTFDDAYELSSEIRDALSKIDEIGVSDLRDIVVETLREKGFLEICENYSSSSANGTTLLVRDRADSAEPFSKATLTRSLEVTAEPKEVLYAVAAAVERTLLNQGLREVRSTELMRVTYERLNKLVTEKSARRYLRWQEFTDTDRPLILLVGGVTGTGKSTISSLLAHRLGIVRTQSTDMLREVMRRIIPKRLIPALHSSSFSAYQSLPKWGRGDGSTVEAHMVDGYLLQSEEVGVGIEGVFRRAIREQVSLIIEGVHLHPGLCRSLARTKDAVVVPVLLATLRRKTLKKQLIGRGTEVATRRAERYLDHLDGIWDLQTFLLSEADRHKVPIITEAEPDEMVRSIMRVVAEKLRNEYEGDPGALLSVP